MNVKERGSAAVPLGDVHVEQVAPASRLFVRDVAYELDAVSFGVRVGIQVRDPRPEMQRAVPEAYQAIAKRRLGAHEMEVLHDASERAPKDAKMR